MAQSLSSGAVGFEAEPLVSGVGLQGELVLAATVLGLKQWLQFRVLLFQAVLRPSWKTCGGKGLLEIHISNPCLKWV